MQRAEVAGDVDDPGVLGLSSSDSIALIARTTPTTLVA